MAKLNDLEQSAAGKWRTDSSELASAAKFLDESGRMTASKLTPDIIASRLRESMTPTAQ
jgi:post-segregation antitoxin (ccd killing protein)